MTTDTATAADGRTFGEWCDEDFVGDDGAAAFDVTTDTTETLRERHASHARRLREGDVDDDMVDFERAYLAAVTRELAYRRRLRVVPADYDDATEAAIALLEARDDVTKVSDSLWLNVEFDSAHVALSTVLAPFDYDTQSVDITNDGGLRVGIRIRDFGDGVDRVRSKHFFGEYTTPNVSAAVLKD